LDEGSKLIGMQRIADRDAEQVDAIDEDAAQSPDADDDTPTA